MLLEVESIVETGSRISRMAMNEMYERWCAEEGFTNSNLQEETLCSITGHWKLFPKKGEELVPQPLPYTVGKQIHQDRYRKAYIIPR